MIKYKARLVWPVFESMCLGALVFNSRVAEDRNLHELGDVLPTLTDSSSLAQIEALRLAEKLH